LPALPVISTLLHLRSGFSALRMCTMCIPYSLQLIEVCVLSSRTLTLTPTVAVKVKLDDTRVAGSGEGGAAGARATPTLIEGEMPPTLVQCYRVLPLLVGPVYYQWYIKQSVLMCHIRGGRRDVNSI